MLLKTGQTTSYVDYDDGYYEEGIAKDYTVLSTGDYSGTTNITLNAKTDAHSNNCVQDNSTGLMWSRYISGSLGPGSDGKLPWTTNGDGEGIFPYVAAANAASLAGHADWRVPYVFELESITDLEVPNALPDAVAFPVWQLNFVWSSTTGPTLTARAFNFHYSIGESGRTVKTTSYYCALVRN